MNNVGRLPDASEDFLFVDDDAFLWDALVASDDALESELAEIAVANRPNADRAPLIADHERWRAPHFGSWTPIAMIARKHLPMLARNLFRGS